MLRSNARLNQTGRNLLRALRLIARSGGNANRATSVWRIGDNSSCAHHPHARTTSRSHGKPFYPPSLMRRGGLAALQTMREGPPAFPMNIRQPPAVCSLRNIARKNCIWPVILGLVAAITSANFTLRRLPETDLLPLVLSRTWALRCRTNRQTVQTNSNAT